MGEVSAQAGIAAAVSAKHMLPRAPKHGAHAGTAGSPPMQQGMRTWAGRVAHGDPGAPVGGHRADAGPPLPLHAAAPAAAAAGAAHLLAAQAAAAARVGGQAAAAGGAGGRDGHCRRIEPVSYGGGQLLGPRRRGGLATRGAGPAAARGRAARAEPALLAALVAARAAAGAAHGAQAAGQQRVGGGHRRRCALPALGRAPGCHLLALTLAVLFQHWLNVGLSQGRLRRLHIHLRQVELLAASRGRGIDSCSEGGQESGACSREQAHSGAHLRQPLWLQLPQSAWAPPAPRPLTWCCAPRCGASS